ncbi:peptide chain release factor N(5)-glutamine methyltransferase [Puniceibacterium sediminis]|uniref:Release factor glutamine methyltransferase n=1 Tax=Puniceibacterium sediminis TaxID=1608407 RepID=A0A238W7E2_9RHOB|nr:peptide chain release factor N(5)-glutamine methyltransferase [Puniceibacterium sediminis]SNR42103.1 [protein release factor]-glutamine N5-methyltransferase [Puniceibacterium sediminis]
MTGAELLVRGARTLKLASVPDPATDARRLLAHALGVQTGRLTLFLPEDVSVSQTEFYDDLIARRAHREPVSHLTGKRMFYGRDFRVTKDVLDPRPETETLIEAALAQKFQRVLDLGTGSGCIVLTLVAECDGATGVGTDLSDAALTIARSNRTALGLDDRVSLETGSWFAALGNRGERFDLIVSNPPYIAADEMADLAPEVREHEPRMALTDEGDGLAAYRAIIAEAPAHLAAGGRLLVEIGPTQGAEVSAMMVAAGLAKITVFQDMDGRDRAVQGCMPRV